MGAMLSMRWAWARDHPKAKKNKTSSKNLEPFSIAMKINELNKN